MRQRLGGLVAAALERVDTQVERRAARQRRAFGDTIVAECTREMRIEPFRIVARNPRRRAVKAWRRKPRALRLAQGAGRMAAILNEARDRGKIELALERQHAQHYCARAGLADQEGRRRLAP